MVSDAYKVFLVLFLSGFMPVTVVSFLVVRRSKKAAEFARVVDVLGIASNVAEFARSRVAEQYAGSAFRMPVLFAWLIAGIGFVSLLFGYDLVSEHQGKINFLLTGAAAGSAEQLQALRVQSMMVMSLAFIGAFLWSAKNILYRLNAGDLAPAVYFNSGLRMIMAPVLSLMITHVVEGFETLGTLRPGLPAIAFLVGWFPDRALVFLKEQFPVIFKEDNMAHRLPLTMIEGVHTYDRARLNELGIEDAQNLASANFIELVLRTAFNPGKLIDWIGQAQLYTYFKDEVTALRSHQIRTVFDVLPLCQQPDLLQAVADNTKIDAARLSLYCVQHGNEPGLRQLLAFQQRLCTVGTDEIVSHGPAAIPVAEPPGEAQEAATPLTLLK